MDENIIRIDSASTIEAINRSEIDMQVATAKRYPRNIKKVLDEIKTLAAHDPQTAADCFYCLRRQGSNIEGLSVRMAEIIAGAWGNLRVASRIVANDGKTITAQAVCMDLEKNVAVSTEVKRRITDKNGRTFSEDMQVVTGNAACSIAFRNAVLKVVPKALTASVIDQVKNVSIGQALDIATMRERMVEWFANRGIPEKDLLEWCDLNSREELTQETLMELRGLCTAITEGDTSIEEAIIAPLRQKRIDAEAAKKQGTNQGTVMAAMARNGAKEAAHGTEAPAEAQQTAEGENKA